ncbi:MAG: GNAT family N-acetyltransferase [Actinomycetota bacterium]
MPPTRRRSRTCGGRSGSRPARRPRSTGTRSSRTCPRSSRTYWPPGRPWRAWVAEDEGRLVGCVWVQLVELVPHPNRSRWERPIVYLTNMFVESGRRDAGLGRALLEAGLAFARERGAGGVVLWPSERSRAFYERAGFAAGAGPMWLELEGD